MTTTMSPPALLNLSDLSGRIDVQGFYERQGIAIVGKPSVDRRDGTEWHGNCPECHGNDRFAFWASGRFSCSLRSSGCGIHGSSPYFFLRDVKGYSHQQALFELGIDQSEIGGSHSQPKTVLPLFMLKDEPPCQKWQEQAHLMCHVWEKVLWSKAGQTARDYLHSRGFKDDTIKTAHLGLNPSWHIESLETWGLSPEQLGKSEDPQIKIPRGLILPWYVENSIWKIQVRRPEPGPDGKKYKSVTGSSDALYNIDALRPGQPVLLVESELDALSAQQEAGKLVACVATGSTAKGRAIRWIGKLKLASQVLQAFDIDENRAGERAADEWLKALPNAMRWTPWSHDVNDMLREGQSIRDWVEMGIILSQSEGPFSTEELEQGEEETWKHVTSESVQVLLSNVVPPALDKNGKEVPPELVERVAAFQSGVGCIGCGGNDWMLDPWNEDLGLLICPCLMTKREENLRLDAKLKAEKRKDEIIKRFRK